MNKHEQDTRIGLRLKTLREARGVSQERLAAGMQIENRQTIAAIEAGARRVSAEELARAAALLGV
ncbi:MAG TPA: helix-turn-helix transcriptional regulator, partial [Longimicrobium sp.]|nr:helix-turn-helix transcriptional regulator [Longimicrobium sp.]